MKRVMLSLIALALGSGGTQALRRTAQTWPTKPVRMVVGFGAGGAMDVLGRSVAEKLSKYNGQTFLIDNRPGAAGNIGAGIVARANPDGYHLLYTPGSVLTMNPSLYAQVPFDAESFAPVSLLADMAVLLVVHQGILRKMSASSSARPGVIPGKMNFSSPGAGSSLHLASGAIPAHCRCHHPAYPLQERRRSRDGCAVGTGNRHVREPAARDVAHQGGNTASAEHSGLHTPAAVAGCAYHIRGRAGWLRCFVMVRAVAPARTPRPLVNHLSTQVAKALREPDVQQRLIELGVRPIGSNPDEFADYLRKDRAKWDGIIRSANIRLE